MLWQEVLGAARQGCVTWASWDLITRTRLVGEPMSRIAEEMNVPRSTLYQRRWRAERKLLQLILNNWTS